MGSFRNQLLVLIIGLVVVTQSVTLVAVLARVENTVEGRAAGELSAGGAFIEQLMRFRASQLASGVNVLAADYGFREAMATGDGPTQLSAANNHLRRIGADLMLLLDNEGSLITATRAVDAGSQGALRQLLAATDMAADRPHVMAIGGRPYQFFVAPVRAPAVIGYVAMGFAVDDTLARKMSEMVGAQISLVSARADGTPFVASSLEGANRTALDGASLETLQAAGAKHIQLGSQQYLSVSRQLQSSPDTVSVLVQRPMHAVMAPYRDVRDAMFAIGTIALLAAIGMGLLRAEARRNLSPLWCGRRAESKKAVTTIRSR
jgi:hypothetical protein